MVVDAVIVNWNGGPEVVTAVKSALRFGAIPIVVDNASTGGSLPDIEAVPGVTVIRNEQNLGFSAGCNIGAAAGSGEIVMLLNPDAEILEGTVADLERGFAASGATALGCRLINGNGTPIRSVLDLPRFTDFTDDLLRIRALRRRISPITGHEADGQPITPVEGWIVGSALAIRRTDWDRLGGLDEGFFLWYEDLDFGARLAAAGGTVAHVPAMLVRHTGASTWVKLPRRRRQWFRIRGSLRYANRHMGPIAAALVVALAPAAMAIGVAQDVAHFFRRG